MDIAPDAAQLTHDLTVLCGRSLSDGRSAQGFADKRFTRKNGGVRQCGHSVKFCLCHTDLNFFCSSHDNSAGVFGDTPQTSEFCPKIQCLLRLMDICPLPFSPFVFLIGKSFGFPNFELPQQFRTFVILIFIICNHLYQLNSYYLTY